MATEDKPELFYFDAPGRAEVTRLTFVYAGKDFKDTRFSFEEWSAKYKVQSPLGTAPFLDVGGFKFGGSLGIARYVGETNGLGGKDALENAHLESLSDAIFDYAKLLHPLMFGPEEKKADARKEALNSLPTKLKILNDMVLGEDTFLAGKQSYPDFHISAYHADCTRFQLGEVFKDCPKLQKTIARVDGNDKIKAFRAKHPPPTS